MRGNVVDLDEAATHVFNAINSRRRPGGYAPIAHFSELATDGLPQPIEEWELIRSALESMSDSVLAALCERRGWQVVAPAKT